MIVETYISKIIANGSAFGYIVGGERDGDSVFLPARVVPIKATESDIIEVFTVTNRDDPTGRSKWMAVGPLNEEHSPESWELEDDEEDQGRAFTGKDVIDHIKAAEAPFRARDLDVVFRATSDVDRQKIRVALAEATDLTTIRVSGPNRSCTVLFFCDSPATALDFLTGE